MRSSLRALVVLPVLVGAFGCSGPDPEAPAPAPVATSFDLPSEQAATYPTAYVAQVVAAPAGDDLAEGAGEHVVIANNADIRIDMGGWALEDAQGNRLPLGIGRQIDVGTRLRVHPSCGPEGEEAVFACTGVELLDDDADVIRLLDAAGAEVAVLAYGGAD